MAPPQGLLIGNERKPWRIGRQIGSGACGAVHELTSDTNTLQYVVKVAPLPPPMKNLKKKKSVEQKNADLLYYESLMYRAHLPRLQGTFIPRVPRMGDSSAPPFLHEEHGFRFMVMERMERTLMDIIPALQQQSNPKQKKITFGPIAVALVDCMQVIHDNGYLFVDVKPENFMLALPGSNPKKKKQDSIENRIRMIDLGLMKPLRDVSGKHKQNEETQLVGTPLYSSLNAHEGHTMSRRDDLEAVGYVIAELLISLLSQVAGDKKSKATPSLPWSNGSSEDDIYNIKKEETENKKSQLFKSLGLGGNDNLSKTIWLYLQTVRAMNFKDKPDYASLKTILKDLDVVVGSARISSSAAKRTPTTSPKRGSTRRTNARAAKAPVINVDSESDESEPDVPRRQTRSGRGRKRPSPRNQSEDVVAAPSKAGRFRKSDNDSDLDDSALMETDDDSESGAEDSNDSMDWEAVPDENHAPSNKSGHGMGVKITFTDGPHQGESFLLREEPNNTVLLGRNPKAKSGEAFQLRRDTEVDSSHVKLVLHVSKKCCSVGVADLKSSSGSYLNGNRIPKGKEQRAFINDKVCIGESTFQIQKLSTNESAPKKRAASKTKTVKRGPPRKDPPKKARKSSGAGVCIEIINGKHKGECFTLEKNASETIVVGTDPTAKSGDNVFCLANDKDADESHVKLELVSASKKLCSVRVTDLKSNSGTHVNGQQVPKGKNRVVFINDKIQLGNQTVMQIKSL